MVYNSKKLGGILPTCIDSIHIAFTRIDSPDDRPKFHLEWILHHGFIAFYFDFLGINGIAAVAFVKCDRIMQGS